MSLISIEDAYEDWKRDHAAEIPDHDECMRSESWNDYTDGLCKDGSFTGLQYHHCPADGDRMPDNDFEHVLGRLGWEVNVMQGKQIGDSDVYEYELKLGGGEATKVTVYLPQDEAYLNDVAAAFLAMGDEIISNNLVGKSTADDLRELVEAFY